jgi:hypothetical protein
MGRKNIDRIPLTDRYGEGQTVAHMAVAGWEVITRCQACGLMMVVDLKLVATVSGPATSLWNRKARCRRIGCNGWVQFQAKAPGMPYYSELAIDHDRAPEPGFMERHIASLKVGKP